MVHFIGLCQLHTKLCNGPFCMQLPKAYKAEASCSQVVIDSAAYMVKINS